MRRAVPRHRPKPACADGHCRAYGRGARHRAGARQPLPRRHARRAGHPGGRRDDRRLGVEGHRGARARGQAPGAGRTPKRACTAQSRNGKRPCRRKKRARRAGLRRKSHRSRARPRPGGRSAATGAGVPARGAGGQPAGAV